MAKGTGRLQKYAVSLYPEDVAVLAEAHPETGYNQIIRELVHQAAEYTKKHFSPSNPPK